MIKAYKAGYIKYDNEEGKRKGHYCVIEMTIETMPCIQLMILSQDGLVSSHLVDSVTEITGYHRYTVKEGVNLGAGELSPLNTANPNGMLEGLANQMNYAYPIMATAFGEGLLKLTDF